MTIKEAQSIKWGTKLVLTKLGKSTFDAKRYSNGAIFLKHNGGGSLTLLVHGRVTPSIWARGFWKIATPNG